MTPAVATHNDVRADFFATLASGFSPPRAPGFQEALIAHLADDLEDMTATLGYSASQQPLVALRTSVAQLEQPNHLLLIYSGLFLTPPVPVHLNTAFYLDAEIRGDAEYEMRQWYARHRMGQDAQAGVKADHIGANLYFVAELFRRAHGAFAAGEGIDGVAQATEARRFLAAYPRRWLPPVQAACTRACEQRDYPAIYACLLDLLAIAIDAEIEKEVARSPVTALDAACPAYPPGSSRGIGGPTAEDLAEIACRLQASNLSFEHIRQRPEWREEVFRRR
ncbi:MAG: molecular chaperone TorD family protein, partial [Halioglobus sp.]|nr:molecular chaperone TorD family protein [Halioglobus sp.]